MKLKLNAVPSALMFSAILLTGCNQSQQDREGKAESKAPSASEALEPKVSRIDESKTWSFQCPVARAEFRPAIYIIGEDRPETKLMASDVYSNHSIINRMKRSRIARRLVDGEFVVAREAATFRGLQVADTKELVLRGLLGEGRDRDASYLMDIALSSDWNQYAYGLESDLSMMPAHLIPHLAVYFNRTLSKELDKDLRNAMRFKLHLRIIERLASESALLDAWRSLSRPFADSTAEAFAANFFDPAIGKKEYAIGLARLPADSDLMQDLYRFMNSKAYAVVIRDLTVAAAGRLAKDRGASEQQVAQESVELKKLLSQGLDTESRSRLLKIISKYTVDYRNEDWIKNLSQLYCRSIDSDRSLVIIVNADNRVGLEAGLKKLANGEELTILSELDLN